MKKWSALLIVLIIFFLCLIYNDEIVTFLINNFSSIERKTTKLENNNYARSEDYKFVQLTSDFRPKDRQELLNIYYTILNSGMEKFTFYCPSDYKDCIKDVDYISNNQVLLSNINNFVHVYNSFENIETEFDSLGKVTVYIKHNYKAKEISELQLVVTSIIENNIKDNMSVENKIKVLHDYIINNTKYDVNRSDNKVTSYNSDTAYGALIQHYAICGGYADSIKLFLDYLEIPNYKISSENHIWNLVFINGKWHHLDLTWDDPVTSDGKDILEYDYFLISTDELKKLETDQHVFDTEIYLEAN